MLLEKSRKFKKLIYVPLLKLISVNVINFFEHISVAFHFPCVYSYKEKSVQALID